MLRPYDLMCLGMEEPRGITGSPEFSWRLRGEGDMSAYRIRVCGQGGELMWDSGRRVPSPGEGRARAVPYEGGALSSGEVYCWELMVWDAFGVPSHDVSASFGMGHLERSWKASWVEAPIERKPSQDCKDPGLILSGNLPGEAPADERLNPPTIFRRTVTVPHGVRRATLYATAYGVYQAFIDGVCVSEELAPGYSQYDRTLEAQTMDVTALLLPGTHELAFVLADGWYAGKIGLMGIGEQHGSVPALLAELDVMLEDGSCLSVGTGERFSCSLGSWRYADLFVGESFDEGLEPVELGPARACDRPMDVICGREAPPVRVTRTIAPQLIRTPAGELVLDAGENLAGIVAIEMPAAPGMRVTLEHSEVLDKNGCFQSNIIGQNKDQTDVLVCAGSYASWRPRLTFHGFRYVRLTMDGAPFSPEEVDPDWFRILALGSDLEETGSFCCSDQDLCRLNENVVRSQRANMLSIPTDCPQRERAGWTADMQVFAATACFNQDVRAFLGRWLKSMRLAQRPSGAVPNVIPWIPSNVLIDGTEDGSAGWGDCCVLLPWRLYEAYGDEEILRDCLPMMEAWMGHVQKLAESSGNPRLWDTGRQFGDWLVPSLREKESPFETAERTKAVASTAVWCLSAQAMAKVHRVLGNACDVARYEELARSIQAAFAEAFISPDGHVGYDLQGAYVLALAAGAVPADLEGACVGRLVELIHQAGDCLDVGFLSVPYLLDVLMEHGREDLAITLLGQHDAPSWLYAVDRGATTVWENWVAIRPDGTVTDSSYNHFAFGCVGEFLYRRIAGMAPGEPGWARVRFEPLVDCGLQSASAWHETPYGKASISWWRDETAVRIRMELPPEVTGVLAVGGEEREIVSGVTELVLAAMPARSA